MATGRGAAGRGAADLPARGRRPQAAEPAGAASLTGPARAAAAAVPKLASGGGS